LKTPDLPSVNAAMPHRMSWKDIRDNTNKFWEGEEDEEDFERWTDRFLEAGREKIREYKDKHETAKSEGKKYRARNLKKLLERKRASQKSFADARKAFLADPTDEAKKTEFLRQANSFHANVPDLGPHRGVNNPVSEATHLHLRRSRGRKRRRSPSPMSRRVLDMSPERLSGIAMTTDDEIITTTGETFPPKKLTRQHRKRFKRHDTKAIKSFDPDASFG